MVTALMRRPDDPDDPVVPDGDVDDVDAQDRRTLLAAQHDLRAFAPIYQRYHQAIFGYCVRRLRDRDLAADATSVTFSKALASIHGYRSGSVPGWLFAIARNVIVDSVRSSRRHVGLEDAGTVPDRDRLPDEAAIASDQERALRDAMRQLTADQRAVVELRLAGLSGPAIATALGLSLGAVKSSQHRAYRRLRTLLRDEHMFGDES